MDCVPFPLKYSRTVFKFGGHRLSEGVNVPWAPSRHNTGHQKRFDKWLCLLKEHHKVGLCSTDVLTWNLVLLCLNAPAWFVFTSHADCQSSYNIAGRTMASCIWKNFTYVYLTSFPLYFISCDAHDSVFILLMQHFHVLYNIQIRQSNANSVDSDRSAPEEVL